MYLDHFGLIEFPFRITPDPAFLFWTADHHHAHNLLAGAARGERPVTIILGGPGTGKTTLLHQFLARLPKDMRVGMIANYSSGFGGLGHWLHWAFSLRPEGPEGSLRLAFRDFLVARHDDGARCLLVVDEAQNVSDDDIAALTELTRLPGVPGTTLQLVLAGQPELRRRLPAAHDRDEGAVPFQIGPMSPAETKGYIRYRMALAGCRDEVFDDAAAELVARLAGGVPRVVNVLCELLLTSAFGAGEHRIDSVFLDRVLQDVRQTGMLDHLLAEPGHRPPSRGASPSPADTPPPARQESVSAAPPVATADTDRPPAGPVPARTDAPAAPANAPSPPIAPVAVAPGRRRRALPALAAAAAAAAIALAVLPDRPPPPSAGIAALTADHGPISAAAGALDAGVGAALPAPPGLRMTDAAALHDQALVLGVDDPLAAAVGFARAALRGDTRAALYLGQHFEAGDGVPRNAALAAAWYASAADTQRSARRALQKLTDTVASHGNRPPAPPLPLLGVLDASGMAEFVWAMPEGPAARYLIELAESPVSPPAQHGPFDLSAALLAPAAPARLWRVVSLDANGLRTGESGWHPIDAAERAEIAAAP